MLVRTYLVLADLNTLHHTIWELNTKNSLALISPFWYFSGHLFEILCLAVVVTVVVVLGFIVCTCRFLNVVFAGSWPDDDNWN